MAVYRHRQSLLCFTPLSFSRDHNSGGGPSVKLSRSRARRKQHPITKREWYAKYNKDLTGIISGENLIHRDKLLDYFPWKRSDLTEEKRLLKLCNASRLLYDVILCEYLDGDIHKFWPIEQNLNCKLVKNNYRNYICKIYASKILLIQVREFNEKNKIVTILVYSFLWK